MCNMYQSHLVYSLEHYTSTRRYPVYTHIIIGYQHVYMYRKKFNNEYFQFMEDTSTIFCRFHSLFNYKCNIFLYELLIRCVHTYVMVWNVPGLSFTKYLQIHVYKVDDTNMSWDWMTKMWYIALPIVHYILYNT